MDVLLAHDACSSKDQTGHYQGDQSQLPGLGLADDFTLIVVAGFTEAGL
jgi:hypothetical protein